MNDRERLTSTDESGHHHLRKVKQLGNDYASKKVLIQKLGDYENAEEKGELLRVPCKVGDKVFAIVKLMNGKTFVNEGIMFEVASTYEAGTVKTRFYFWANGEEYARRHYSMWYELTEFGKTVFLTREEAENALKGE